ncbi:MAG: TonB-dependent receptor, partial [Bryobacteraceae bacterium]|nr:TonB-dependent receptor [Bryobacteraceae bacterium]
TRQRNNVSNFYTVPTAEMRAGDFSGLPVTLYNPFTGDANGRGREQFPNNRIPASQQSAIARRMQDRVPLPNIQRLDSNYFSSDTQSLDRNNYDVKVNWVRNQKHTLWAKYGAMDAQVTCSYGLGEAGGAGLCNGGGSGVGDTFVHTATIGNTYVITPSFLIDQSFGYSRLWQEVRAPDFGQNIGLDLGIPGTNGPDIRQSGIPTFNITGLSAWGNTDTWSPTFRYDDTFTNNINGSWNKGSHEIRFGSDMIRLQLNHWQPQIGGGPRGAFNFTGAITGLNGGAAPNQYNAYGAYLLGLPSQVSKTLQFYSPMTTREWQFGWYVRDRWQVSRRLTVTLGVRFEYLPLLKRKDTGIERYNIETNEVFLGGLGSTPNDAGVDAKTTQFSPRVGFAYRMGDKTVIRAGYGLSYDPMPLSRPFRGTYPAMISNDFVSPNTFSFVSPLQQGIPEFVLPDVSSGVVPLPLTATTITPPRKFRRGYIQSWNLIVERKLPMDLVASVGYVATKTVRQLSDLNLNAAGPGEGNVGRPLARAFGRLVDTTLTDAFVDSNYHSLQTTLNRRFSNGLLIRANYTFSRAINENDEPSRGGLLFNHPSVRSRNRALAGFDRPHNFQAGFLYELPFGPGKALANGGGWMSAIARGWQINGIVGAYSGTPFTITASGASLNAPGNTQTADQVKPEVSTGGAIGPGALWLDTSAFAAVTDVRFGNTGRNAFRGPGAIRVDGSLFRQFRVTERANLQFRAEAFNLPNHPQFNNPGNAVNSANFGMITSAKTTERQIRVGLRLGF